MTDYSQMSDTEINKLVGEKLGVKPRKTFCVIAYKESEDIWPDYCNDPAVAWPIINENRIAIIPDSAEGEWVAFNNFTLYEGDWLFASDPAYHSNGKNPLRCAMECFLLMKDSGHANS